MKERHTQFRGAKESNEEVEVEEENSIRGLMFVSAPSLSEAFEIQFCGIFDGEIIPGGLIRR